MEDIIQHPTQGSIRQSPSVQRIMQLSFLTVILRQRLAAALGLTLMFLMLTSTQGAEPSVAPAMAQAESLVSKGAYAEALRAYQAMESRPPKGVDPRWIRFRIADCTWRSFVAAPRADDTEWLEAIRTLNQLAADLEGEVSRPQLWAEIQESLGDHFWMPSRRSQWGTSMGHYEKALDWWAGSTEIDLARQRYLDIIWKASEGVTTPTPRFSPFPMGILVPRHLLEKAAEIALSQEDRSRAHYLLALHDLRQGGQDWRTHRRLPQLFEGALTAGKASRWHDDALMQYARWLSTHGRIEVDEKGGWRATPDYEKALEVCQTLIREYQPAESQYRRQAESLVKQITQPILRILVDQAFLPGTAVEVGLSWRNVDEVQFSLHPIQLLKDVKMRDAVNNLRDWIREDGSKFSKNPTQEWTWKPQEGPAHRLGQDRISIPKALAPGAYLLRARQGETSSTELVMVTDLALSLRSAGGEVLAFVTEAASGKPVADAELVLWQSVQNGRQYQSRRYQAQTGKDGTASVQLPSSTGYARLLAMVNRDGHPTFVESGVSGRSEARARGWALYAFTDRSAYRPGETVHWKVIARTRDGEGYQTPGGETLKFTLRDGANQVVHQGEVTLNDWGAGWSQVEISEDWKLGRCRAEFQSADGRQGLGTADLFQLEAYRLPEFRVETEGPKDPSGIPLTFLLGDRVSAKVRASYYYGAPVAEAEVRVMVREMPYFRHWPAARRFPWLYEESAIRSPFPRGQGGRVVKDLHLRTDSKGELMVEWETPSTQDQSMEYQLEVRVTDAGGREVIQRDSFRVGTQSHEVHLETDSHLIRPGERALVQVKAMDLNDAPVLTSGTLQLLRRVWEESWLDPFGREWSGDALKNLQARQAIWPPPGEPGWDPRIREVKEIPVTRAPIQTELDGTAIWTTPPLEPGQYLARWTSLDDRSGPIQAETGFWVLDEKSHDVGYRHDGIQVTLDRDTVLEGQRLPVMISGAQGNQHVLITIEQDRFLSRQVLFMEGPVRFVELAIDSEHVPNFWITAQAIRNYRHEQDSKAITVPPGKHYLDVTVRPEDEEIRPGAKGRWKVQTLDMQGKPVASEISLALVDASIFAIQKDLAGDPRQFFFGQRRPWAVSSQSSLQRLPFRIEPREALQGEMVAEGLSLGAPVRMMDAAMADGAMAPPMARAFFAKAAGAPGQEAAEEIPVFRSNFKTTAAWIPAIRTDARGTATVEVTYPDNLTEWKAVVRAHHPGQKVGMGEGVALTTQPLAVRLQRPRQMRSGDKAFWTTTLDNNTSSNLSVRVQLLAKQEQTILQDGARDLVLPANSQTPVTWPIQASRPGQVEIEATVLAGGSKLQDGVRDEMEIMDRGMELYERVTAHLKGNAWQQEMVFPGARTPGEVEVHLHITPNLALGMLDSLPQIVSQATSDTEAITSRFLPAAVIARVLEQQGMTLRQIQSRIFDWKGQPANKGGGDQRLEKIIQEGLRQLQEHQNPDGGWSWSTQGPSDRWMSAYILWGLGLLRESGWSSTEKWMERALDYTVDQLIQSEGDPSLRVWMLQACSAHPDSLLNRERQKALQVAWNDLWAGRTRWNACTTALLALTAHQTGRSREARELVTNLANGAVLTEDPGQSSIGVSSGGSQAPLPQAHWGATRGWRRWHEGGVETTALVLKALSEIQPDHRLCGPAMHWLMRNRHGAQWQNSRATTLSLLGLASWLKVSRQDQASGSWEIRWNDQVIGAVRHDGSLGGMESLNLRVPARHLIQGPQTLKLQRLEGHGELFLAVEAKWNSTEAPLRARGSEVFIRRDRMEWRDHPTLLKGTVSDQHLLASKDAIQPGTRLEMILTVQAGNDWPYVTLIAPHASGLEPAEAVQSGHWEAVELRDASARQLFSENNPVQGIAAEDQSRWMQSVTTGRRIPLAVQWLDDRAEFRTDLLPEGIWQIRYRMKAETSGSFTGMPPTAAAQYLPEVQGNGDEDSLRILPKTR